MNSRLLVAVGIINEEGVHGDCFFRLFSAVGSIVILNNGTCRNSLVTGRIVTEGCSENKSD